MDNTELLTVLSEHRTRREGLLGNWSNFVREHPNKGTNILTQLSPEEPSEMEVYKAGIAGLRELPEDETLRGETLSLLNGVAESVLEQTLHESADLVSRISKKIPDAQRALLLAVWDRLLRTRSTITSYACRCPGRNAEMSMSKCGMLVMESPFVILQRGQSGCISNTLVRGLTLQGLTWSACQPISSSQPHAAQRPPLE